MRLNQESGTPEENAVERFIHDRSDASLYMRKKIPVGILGATGSVGQRLVQLLTNHPWFEITALAASEKSTGKKYQEAVSWMLPTLLPESVANKVVVPCTPNMDCKIVFSAVNSDMAKTIEKEFAEKGYIVISMAKNNRMEATVPMIIPEVNADHLEIVSKQGFKSGGMIITKPNCAVIGLAMALKPLALEFGIKAAHVVTFQSTSGAGYPGVPSLALFDNVIPYINDEEEKVETETQKVLGDVEKGKFEYLPITISSSCARVPVTEGHLEVVSVKLKDKADLDEIKRAWREFSPPIRELNLPSSPKQLIYYFEEPEYPQPKLHRDIDHGMALSLGRLRPCPILDYKFVLLTHNTLRGAAGGAILIAELLVKRGMIYW